MNTNPATADFEIVTLPIGKGWRVRISDGRHLQFIGGFDAKDRADEWVRTSSSNWLDKLKTLTDRL
jgi:hypothetical protein